MVFRELCLREVLSFKTIKKQSQAKKVGNRKLLRLMSVLFEYSEEGPLIYQQEHTVGAVWHKGLSLKLLVRASIIISVVTAVLWMSTQGVREPKVGRCREEQV